MTELLSDEDVFGATSAPALLSDEDVFKVAPKLLSDEDVLGEVPDKSVPFGSFKRGWNRLQQSTNVIASELGLISDEDAAAAIARDEMDIAAAPRPPSVDQGLKEISEADGWGNTALAIISNPSTIVSIIGESIPASVAAQTAGSLAGAAAAPVGGTRLGLVTGTGVASFATEYSQTMLDTLREHGVDLTDAAAVQRALEDDAIMAEARDRGVKRGIPIGTFDAISMGVAGKIFGVSTKSGRAGEVVTQSALGAGGEAGAQIVDQGEITSPGDVLLEGVAESVTGIPDIAIGTIAQPREGVPLDESGVPQGAAPAETLFGADPAAAPASPAVTPPAAAPVAQPAPPLLEAPVAAPPPAVAPDRPAAVEAAPAPAVARPDPIATALAESPGKLPNLSLDDLIAAPSAAVPSVDDFLTTLFAKSAASAPAGKPPAGLLSDAEVFAPSRSALPRRDIGADVAVTSAGRQVPVTYAVVEASSLIPSQRDEGGANPSYPAELQPRDRERAVSQAQIHAIAQKLNPRLLDKSPRASDGAPIVAEDGVVESGNGRVLALRRAYGQSLPSAETYRSYLAEQGYPVEGMAQPVLVRVRSGAMEQADRQAFTREANERDTLGMSATERAMADGSAMPAGTLALYRGGDIDSAANRDFVRSFMRSVVNQNDQAGMVDQSGAMSQEAVRRVQAALLAKAYGDADLIAALIESADTNIKAIGGALMDVAADWAQMRSEADDGSINSDVDRTDRLIEAVRLVQRARRDGRNVAEYVGQTDIFSGSTIHAISEAFLRLMFRNDRQWISPVGRDKLADALRFYVTEARKTSPGVDLLGEQAPGAEPILKVAKERQRGSEEGQGGLQFGQRAAEPAREDVRPSGEGRTVPDAAPAEDATGSAVAGESPASRVEPAADADAAYFTEQAAKATARVAAKTPLAGLNGWSIQYTTQGDANETYRVERNGGTSKDDVWGYYSDLPIASSALEKAAGSRRATAKVAPAPEPAPKDAGAELFRVREQTAGGIETEFVLSDAFRDQADALAKDLRKRLDGLGLKDVGVRVHEAIRAIIDGKSFEADGRYFRGLIDIALDAQETTLDHEAIHALKALDLFGETEWTVLARKAENDWLARYDIAERYESFSADRRIEEAIAHAYADWVSGTKFDGILAKSFRKIKALIEALGNALRGLGFNSADDVFATVESGEVGGRERAGPASPGDAMFQSAWHGSPHLFDKFSLDKIGTGEGAQAYGWGLYFSSSREVAEWYKAKLAREPKVTIGGMAINVYDPLGGPLSRDHLPEISAALAPLMKLPEGATKLDGTPITVPEDYFTKSFFPNVALLHELRTLIEDARAGRTPEQAIAERRESIAEALPKQDSDRDRFDVYLHEAIINAIEERGLALEKPGRLFKVDVPEDSELMDWNAQLSEQPLAVREKLRSLDGFDIGGGKIISDGDFRRQYYLPAKALTEGTLVGKAVFNNSTTALKFFGGALSTDAIFEELAKERPGVVAELRDMLEQYGSPTGEDVYRRMIALAADGLLPGEDDDIAVLRSLPERASTALRNAGIPGHKYIGPESQQTNYVIYDDSRVQVEAMFELRRPPRDAAESQQMMQGFITRGQPIDRALRLPFDILGGVDASGRWNPGKRLTDKIGRAGMMGGSLSGVVGAGLGSLVAPGVGTAAGALLGGTVGAYLFGAKINKNGRFGWLHGFAENARQGLIDRYGLSEEYIAADTRRAQDKRQTMLQAQDILQVLKNASVGTAEAKVLQAVLTGKEVTDADMTKLAMPIRKAIDDMGAEAVSLGLISAESFERNRGSYLHRVYLKNEQDEGGLAGWVSKRMAAKRKRIIGDSMKGRGMFWDVPAERLTKDGGKAPTMGQKYRVLDKVSGERTSRRSYVPADRAVPDGWSDRGVWEVRKAGPTVTLWRDYTEAERTKMGEIVDARYTIARTFMVMANDLSTGKFYKEISENPNWARETEPETGWSEASKYRRSWNDPEIAWVRVPDEAIADTGGKKRWGALAGKFIRAEIWRDLNELDIATKPGAWRKALTQWKVNKALALDTPIPTPTGWTTMGDIKVGDRVFDEKGQVCEVLEVKDVRHGRPCFEVGFSDGTKIVADDEHWWFVVGLNNAKGKVLTTAEIRSTLKTRRGDNRHAVPVAGALHLPSADLPVPPYALGLWLGDGAASAPRITVGSAEIDEVERELAEVGVYSGKRCPDKRSTAVTFQISTEPIRQGSAANPFKQGLKALGVLNAKHIPAVYLRASVDQRMALLQGLMDSDGWVTEKGTCGFATSERALLQGALELLRSLGYKPTISEKTIVGRPAWRVHFQAYSDRPVVRLHRKLARLRERPAARQRSGTRQIVSIEPAASVPVRCISVSSASQLYLAGDGMVPTHNTARSPVVHMNNIMSNMMFMDLADVRMQDLSRGLRAFIKQDAEFKAARDNGAFGSDMVSQEIRDNVLKPLLEEITKQDQGTRNVFLSRLGVLGKMADLIWTGVKKADRAMLNAYQIEDEIFRMATYLRRRSLGDSPEVAAKNAKEAFLDYDIRAPWVVAARNSVFPFISYTYRAVPKLAENIAHRPWKIAKYFAIAYAVNALGYLWDDGEDGEERERASLRDEEQGYMWLGVPRMLRMPYRDDEGLPVFLDVRRWIPSGDIFDLEQGQSAIPIPAPMQFGGPFLLAFEFLLNRQAFTGDDITNDLVDDNADKAEKVGDWLWKSWMPSAMWIPNSWYWTKVHNALSGATDAKGRDYGLKEALASSIGIKLKPQDVESGIFWHNRDFQKVQQALRAELRDLGRKRERNLISQEEYDRGAAKLTDKFTRLQKKAEEFNKRAQPAGAD